MSSKPVHRIARVGAVLLAALSVTAASATVGGAAGTGSPGTAGSGTFGVGLITETFVDAHRPTAAWGPSPELPSRTLVTTVLYPTTGPAARAPVPDGPADRTAAPYPLIVFAHGLGATPQTYLKLLSSWAAAGFVVAAPRFPLSSGATPGGPDGADIVNQPGDMAYVIGAVLKLSAQSTSPLAGLVNPKEVGAAGHSNGAITTLGLVANTCCRDPLVKAAVVMAGTTEGFPGGHYDFTKTPPLLLVHDTDDSVVPYRSAVQVFNQAHGPKGLLTIHGTSRTSSAGLAAHMAASGVSGPSSAAVIRTTTAFFDAYLRGERSALAEIGRDGRSRSTTIRFAASVGARVTLPVPPLPVVHLKASVVPSAGLKDGQTVTVHWSGYTAGKVVNILECSKIDLKTADSNGCDFFNAKILHPDPTGSGTLKLQVVSGTVGDGVCNATHGGCSIVVNNASSTDPHETVQLPIRFST